MTLRMPAEWEKQKAADILALSHIDLSQVDLIRVPTNRSWLRDSAPVFVSDGKQRALLNWRFNAWAKYDNWQSDDKYQVTWHLVAAMFVQGQLFGWAKGNEGYLQDHLSERQNLHRTGSHRHPQLLRKCQ